MRRKRHPIHRFIVLVVSRPRATLASTLVIAAACVALAVARLRISTDQNKLFSAGDGGCFGGYLPGAGGGLGHGGGVGEAGGFRVTDAARERAG